MIRSISRQWWLAVLPLLWLGASAQTHAQSPMVKASQFRVNFHVEVTTTPDPNRPTAPWYAYFPADPRLLPSPQVTPYPPWPMRFPPQAPSTDAPKDGQKRSSNPTPFQGPLLTYYSPTNYASSVQPVGYTPMQVPSYWYQGR